MQILLSNDDGYQASGLRLLAGALGDIADVVVVAPDRNRSGASNALTLDAPLRVEQIDPNTYSVNGTPADCVHIAITGLLNTEPDMVVSGINHGANLGDDVIYSGTVGAAIEGRFLGLPAVAVSLVAEEDKHFETAVSVVYQIIEGMKNNPLPSDTILNINVPDLSEENICGIKATRLGGRYRSDPVVIARDPKNRPVYWIGPAGKGQDAGPGTDFDAIAKGYVSVTPIKVDSTDYGVLETLDTWLKKLR